MNIAKQDVKLPRPKYFPILRTEDIILPSNLLLIKSYAIILHRNNFKFYVYNAYHLTTKKLWSEHFHQQGLRTRNIVQINFHNPLTQMALSPLTVGMNHRQKTCIGEKLLRPQLALIYPTKKYLHAHKAKNCDTVLFNLWRAWIIIVNNFTK